MTDNPMQSKRYRETCDAISRAIAVWFEVHPGADPQFSFPPERVVVTGDLDFGLTYWEPNDDGRNLVGYVDHATGRTASMLQFEVCYGHYQKYRKGAHA